MKALDVEDIYELCPMQEGMLFHSQLEPQAGYYVEQFYGRLHGCINPANFQLAWQKIVDRHGVLRSSVQWDERQEPVQAMHRDMPIHLQRLDWRDVPAADQDACLKWFLHADRCRGFDLERPPLMRLCLIASAEDRFHFIWTFHHLLLDGWSYPIVLKEVFSSYEALAQGKHLEFEPCRPYRDYLTWRRHLDLTEAVAYWRQALKGYTPRSTLQRAFCSSPKPKTEMAGLPGSWPEALPNSIEDEHGQQQFHLGNELTMALRSLARQHRLTLNTVLQGAWALLLYRLTGDTDVVFGATVAGRPPALAGIESMVGLFINTLPVRARISGDEWLLPWFKQLQDQQIELRQFEGTPLVLIQKCVELPPGVPLFESILVYENVPFDSALWERFQSFQMRDVRFISKTHYPLTLSVFATTDLSLNLNYARRHFDDGCIRRLIEDLGALLEGIARDPHRRIGEFSLQASREHRPLADDRTRPHAVSAI